MKVHYRVTPTLERPSLMRQQWSWPIIALILTCLFYSPWGFSADTSQESDSALWEALRSGGHVVLLRHAIAPGTGDPSNFTLGDCSTQRNLSDQGRAQARRIGARFRSNGVEVAGVYSSQWCRTLETAEWLELGPVQALPALNSFFQDYQKREPQTQALRQWISDQDLAQPLVLVTHQVNITALTDVYPASGELIVLRRNAEDELAVVGTLETN